MNEIKFDYIAQHEDTDIFMHQQFTLEQIEGSDFIKQWQQKFKRFFIIARRRYSGFNLSDGREVYEGDIFEVIDDANILIRCVCEYGKFIREIYDNEVEIHGFYFRRLYDNKKTFTITKNYLNKHDIDMFKYVGNIYENLELMK